MKSEKAVSTKKGEGKSKMTSEGRTKDKLGRCISLSEMRLKAFQR